jgi:TonB family protein
MNKVFFGSLLLGLTACAAAQPFQLERTFNPSVRFRVEPQYSPQALDAKLTGKALVVVTVDERGVPTEVKFGRWISTISSNPMGLDEAAVAAVRQWRFYPQIVWGKPKGFTASITVEFDPVRHPEQVRGRIRI